MMKRETYPPMMISVKEAARKDYYQFSMTLDEVMQKYKHYGEEQIRDALGVYDLSETEKCAWQRNSYPKWMLEEWEALRKLFWSGKWTLKKKVKTKHE